MALIIIKSNKLTLSYQKKKKNFDYDIQANIPIVSIHAISRKKRG